ncbi:FMN-binding negative transcriptional regulator [Streptomyces sp. NPDC046727]|uniref:FMN-binding negative transcriptional regulator n=1 Tax=Streptomyces sp. NPDC046727 TaxID=3155373 RepID=UPI0033D81382
MLIADLDRPDRETDPGSLVGHMARSNDPWREPVRGEALAIVRGPNGYVTRTWYPTKAAQLSRLTCLHEAGSVEPWSVDQAPAPFVEGRLRAVVGVEPVRAASGPGRCPAGAP